MRFIYSFKLNDEKDIDIKNNQIQTIDDLDLLAQKIKQVLSTNKKEWKFDEIEGINFSNILGKNISDEVIRDEILNGIKQIDENLSLDNFICNKNKRDRTLAVSFSVLDKNSNSVNIEVNY